MVIDMAFASAMVGILTFICGGFNYIVIKPLKKAIDDLSIVINELKKESKERTNTIHQVNTRLTLVEDIVDRLERKIDKLESNS